MVQECFAVISFSGLENHTFLHVHLASETMMRSVALMSATKCKSLKRISVLMDTSHRFTLYVTEDVTRGRR
jgi:hypothetical protein